MTSCDVNLGRVLTIGIATAGRSGIVAANLLHLAELEDQADRLIICIPDDEELDEHALSAVAGASIHVEMMKSPKGSCAQRNAIFRHEAASGTDYLVFLDDDFLVSDGYFSATKRLLGENDDIVLATGNVLADGATGPGYMPEDGMTILQTAPDAPDEAELEDIHSVYGCNMTMRLSAFDREEELFDEALPLYGWLEDMDFSARARKRGRVVRSRTLQGVHLGTKVGRTPGVRLGYSQIANPLYLLQKGSIGRSRAFRLMTRNVLANLAGSFFPPEWIDRRGRLKGNFTALRDVLRKQNSPSRILGL